MSLRTVRAETSAHFPPARLAPTALLDCAWTRPMDRPAVDEPRFSPNYFCYDAVIDESPCCVADDHVDGGTDDHGQHGSHGHTDDKHDEKHDEKKGKHGHDHDRDHNHADDGSHDGEH